MRQFLFILTLMCCGILAVSLCAEQSAYTKIQLSKQENKFKRIRSQSLGKTQVIFNSDDETLSELKSKGLTVNSRFGSLVTAQIPLSLIPETKNLKFSLPRKLALCNDSAICFSNGVDALSGSGFDRAYSGRGVLIGMIDVGFDFNHINFLDSIGNNRIVRVYMPADSAGNSPIIDGDTLPGSEYMTPEEIKKLTTDDSNNLHATHTTGTAAGGYMGNPYHGVAIGAEIIACGMPDAELTDVNIINSLRYIFNYAHQVGKPCVVNMSIGDFEGPHDGTSNLCKVIDELSGNGNICVLSAGNDGNKNICIHKEFSSESDTLNTCLSNRYYGYNISGAISMWSQTSQEHQVRFKVINRQTKYVYYTSPWLSSLPEDSVYHVSSETDTLFAKYFDGYIYYASALESNNKFHSIFEADAKYVKDSNNTIVLQYVSQSGTQLRGWGSSNMRFVTYNMPGFVAGDNSMSISDLATGDSSITVGAYYSRCLPTVISGVNSTITNGSHPTDITAFSSYGPDVNGLNHPDIVAPGHALVSSYSRFNSMSNNNNWLCWNEVFDGVAYPYGIDTGTSMSAPVVTGSIALWLEANPNLGPSDIKNILKETANRDEYVVNGSPAKWGYGKLDISAGLHYVLGNVVGDINADGVVNVSDVSALVSKVLNLSVDDNCDINKDGIVDVSDVAVLINLILSD